MLPDVEAEKVRNGEADRLGRENGSFEIERLEMEGLEETGWIGSF